MITQMQLYYKAKKSSYICDQHFIDIINNIDNPITSHDLIDLVALSPSRWGKYSQWIKVLQERELLT